MTFNEELFDEYRQFKAFLKTEKEGTRGDNKSSNMNISQEETDLAAPSETPQEAKYNVLVVGDLHEPFTKEGYLEFCQEQYKKWNCNKVVFIGDIIDSHAITFHSVDPDGMSPMDEFELAIYKLKKWYKAFPNAIVTLGNHDLRGPRKAYEAGLPGTWVKSFDERIEAPDTWEFVFDTIIDNTLYRHAGQGGVGGALKTAIQEGMNVVTGHNHTIAGVNWSQNANKRIFGMSTGCGVDVDNYAMAYAKGFSKKFMLSCGIVESGLNAFVIPFNK